MKQDEYKSIIGLLQQHKTWYPLMEGRDIYKLIYQGEMGPEHLVKSLDDFAIRLAVEFDPLIPNSHERIIEPVRHDRRLLRLNLRACKSRALLPEQMLPPLLETANMTRGDLNYVRSAWMSFVRACEQGKMSGFDIMRLRQLTAWLENMDYPVVRHSETYRREYKPAYRLIAKQFISSLGLNHAG